MPFLAPGHGGQRDVFQVVTRAVSRVGSRHQGIEITHHFPMGELLLDALGIVERQRAQNHALGDQGRLHGGLPSGGIRQVQCSTIDKPHGAEQPAGQFAAQYVGQVVQTLGLAQAEGLPQHGKR